MRRTVTNVDRLGLTAGRCTPIEIRAYLRHMKNLLAKLSLFKDDDRVRRAAEYETQLQHMKDSVLKREVAISNSSMSFLHWPSFCWWTDAVACRTPPRASSCTSAAPYR